MQAESAIGRVLLWFGIMLLAGLAALLTHDGGFAVHATIVALVAFILMWMSAGRFDPTGLDPAARAPLPYQHRVALAERARARARARPPRRIPPP